MIKVNSTAIPSLLCDFYKTAHKDQYKTGTTLIYSTWTPRSNKHLDSCDRIVQFGLQGFIKKYLVNYFNTAFFNREEEEVVREYVTFIKRTLGQVVSGEHIRELHKLGYLPILIKAIPEGKSVLPKVPTFTIHNTHSKFFWVTNYLETLLSTSLWQPSTSASIARQYRKVLTQYGVETCDDLSHVDFQAHDFSMRGMSSLESAETSGAGHLTCFTGTDTIPAINYVEAYYPSATHQLVGTSIPATEHSVMCSHGQDELETFRFLIEDVYPSGYVSIVSDTWDFWKNIEETLPKLKDKIMARDGKVVIRPDSGDPVDILIGTEIIRSWDMLDAFHGEGYFFNPEGKVVKVVKSKDDDYEMLVLEDDRTVEQKGLIEALWDIFGGNTNSKGYRVLDSHIGAIYGDSITLPRAKHILYGLKRKRFASSNIVFGVGSYTYQYLTRDSLGFAMKATYAIIEGQEKHLFKDPKTDDGTKRSQRGLVSVIENGSKVIDGLYSDSPELLNSELKTVFVNGDLVQSYLWEEVKENIKLEIEKELANA